MVILKRLFFRSLSSASASDESASPEMPANTTLEEEPQANDYQPKASGSVMSKLLHVQSAPPEFLYENEAWSPEHESVRLFHKGSHHFEDQNLTPSQSQE
ncbi:hypothetical protein [Desulfosporosinus sp. FKA]|uniref:hypothetical protein n=1 Tax=Desulfosporosinus sp. FKA TaxID=1969834 RepID=UPI000B49A3CB|nr:hypothetical protein [Desulfosporosinus sp. FKA]